MSTAAYWIAVLAGPVKTQWPLNKHALRRGELSLLLLLDGQA